MRDDVHRAGNPSTTGTEYPDTSERQIDSGIDPGLVATGELPLELEAEKTGPPIAEQVATYVRVSWQSRRTLWRAALAGLFASVLIAFLIPVRYESTARIIPDAKSQSSLMDMIMGMSDKVPGAGITGELLGFKTPDAIFINILQSRTMQDEVVDRFDLRHVYRVNYQQDARKTLAERTDVSQDTKSGVITVTVTDHDPKRAAAIARMYVTQVNIISARLNTSAARKEREFLELRLQAVKADLDDAEQQLSSYSSKNLTLDIKEQAKAMVGAAAAVKGELIAAESQLKGLEQIYTPENARVRAVRARVTELQSQLTQLGGVDDNATLGSAVTDDQNMYPTIRQLPVLGLRYAELYRRAKIQETVFELLTKQYELAKIQEAKEVPTVRVLDEPIVPEKRSFPPRTLIILFGTILSVVGTSAWLVSESNAASSGNRAGYRLLLTQLSEVGQEAFGLVRGRLAAFHRNGHGPE